MKTLLIAISLVAATPASSAPAIQDPELWTAVTEMHLAHAHAHSATNWFATSVYALIGSSVPFAISQAAAADGHALVEQYARLGMRSLLGLTALGVAPFIYHFMLALKKSKALVVKDGAPDLVRFLAQSPVKQYALASQNPALRDFLVQLYQWLQVIDQSAPPHRDRSIDLMK